MALVRFVAIGAVFSLLAGCSSQPKAAPAQLTTLSEVNDMLHAAGAATGRVPAQLAGIRPRLQSMYPRGYTAVKSGDVVVLWGAPLKGEGDTGKDEAVVAYEKDAPKNGGYVLLSAGTVKKMTADELNSAPKGAKK